MKIKPLHDRILVKRVESEKKSKGGIIIPESVKEVADLSLPLESTDEGTISSVRRRRFPTPAVIFVVVLVLACGGAAAYFLH